MSISMLIVPALIFGAGVGGVTFLIARSRRIERDQNAQASAFEMNMSAPQPPPAEPNPSAQPSPPTPAKPSRGEVRSMNYRDERTMCISVDDLAEGTIPFIGSSALLPDNPPPVNPDAQADSVVGEMSSILTPGALESSTSSHASQPDDNRPITATTPIEPTPFIDSIVQRFQAANLLDKIEGAVRSPNPEICGSVLKLRNGQRLAALETAAPTDLSDLEPLLRHYDGVVAPGPAGEPVHLRRFQTMLSDLISF